MLKRMLTALLCALMALPAAAEEAVNPNEAPAETVAPAAEAPKKTRKPRAKKAETVEGAEAPKKATRKRTSKKAAE